MSVLRVQTLVQLLRERGMQDADRVAYRFVDADRHVDSISYSELDRYARRVAAELQRHRPAGQRALLLFPPGLDYVGTFFGCLYAGVVAVPVYPPQDARRLPRLASVVADCEARFAMTRPELVDVLAPHIDADLVWLAGHDAAAEEWTEHDGRSSDLAFLQYTSGSTSQPRGVMLTHANLLHNLGGMYRWFADSDADDLAVSWLPPYHDMGLIGGILEPLYAGFTSVLMSPLDFLRQPRRWLEAVSDYHATVSAAPNFGYEFCVRKIPEDQRAGLDLSSWRVAVNGAEPVRESTLDRFAEAFAPCGFDRNTFCPSYGLAEATLLVTTDAPGAPIRTTSLAGDRRVACGTAIGQGMAIVDQVTLRPVEPGTVGEIWVSGPSVAKGYWGRATETEGLFRARLPGDTRHYLRTGDLGALDADGHLYVTGRLKDLVIIAGRNIYPQDVERAIEESHPAARPGCGAAFSVSRDDREVLVAVQEVTDSAAEVVAEVARAARIAVRAEYDVDLDDIVLVEARTIPKTSSGKIQRQATRQAYLAGELAVVGGQRSASLIAVPYQAPRDPVEELLAGIWADLVGVDSLGVHDDFFASGGQSLLVNQFVVRIREELPVQVSLGDVFEAPTVAKLAALLSSRALSVDADQLNEILSSPDIH